MSNHKKQTLCLFVSVICAAALLVIPGLLQSRIGNGEYAPIEESPGPYAITNEAWDSHAKTCTLRFQVKDLSDCSIAIIRSSSDRISVEVNGVPYDADEYPSTRQVFIISFASFDLVQSDSPATQGEWPRENVGEEPVEIRLHITASRWDVSDQIFVGTEQSILDTFIVEYQAVNTIVMTALIVMFLYALSLYLAKKTETYLQPFIAYTAFLLLWLSVTNMPRSEAMPAELFDFMQVCGHFYVAYIPFAICVLLSEASTPPRFGFFFRWQGLVLVPLAFGTIGYFVDFGFTMIVVLLICLLYGGYALAVSDVSNKAGILILAIGFGLTIGLKIMAFFADCGFAPDSVFFFMLRKTRFMNLPVMLSIMLFLNLRYASNFQKTEDLNTMLDQKVKERTTELVRQQNLRLGMMANIFHDLRTPLFSIKSCADQLAAGEAGEVEKGKVLEVLHGRISFLSRLIDDLFTASKLEDDELLLEDNPVDLSKTLRTVVEASRALAGENRVTVEYREKSPCFTWGDRYYVSRAFENLITNAIQYTPAEGSVLIELSESEGHAFVSIFNTGKGISLESQPHIFDRYYHRNETTASHHSSGLGLSIAQSIIRKHQGGISVTSEPDKGCTFLVTLPVFPYVSETETAFSECSPVLQEKP